MKNSILKSAMLFAIIMMSIVIFILAYSAYFLSFHSKDKDVPFFSDDYIVCQFEGEVPEISDFKEKIKEFEYSNIAFIDYMSDYRFINYSDKFFKEYGLSKEEKLSDKVFVNKNQENQCYLKDNKEYINLYGEQYEVAGFFVDSESDINASCYIDTNHPNAVKNNMYTYVAIDLDGFHENSRNEIKKTIKNNYEDAVISDWNGKVNGYIYVGDVYFYIVVLCGIILCMNCSDFTDVWVRSYRAELSIRRLVGADEKANHIFILKRFLKLYFYSALSGILVAELIFLIFRNDEKLEAVRLIFGDRLDFKYILLSLISVLLITVIVLEVRYRRDKKKTIMDGVRV